MASPPAAADTAPTVHLVEDHESSRRAATRVLTAAGHRVREYGSADEFLSHAPSGPGCIVLDVHLPGLSGLELQDRLTTAGEDMPVVFLSGQGDVPQTARAMKRGAVDFLTKPINAADLIEAVGRAIARDLEQRATRARRVLLGERYARLTPREREVFSHVVSGQLNKQTAYDLGTSEHTIKVHRQRIMQKLEADSVADLVRVAGELGISPKGGVR
jgi:FixJ family two-component response regulator